MLEIRAGFQSIGDLAARVVRKAGKQTYCKECGGPKLSPTAQRCPTCTDKLYESRRKAAGERRPRKKRRLVPGGGT